MGSKQEVSEIAAGRSSKDDLLRVGDRVRNLENGETAKLIQFEDRDYATVAYEDNGEVRSAYVGSLEKIDDDQVGEEGDSLAGLIAERERIADADNAAVSGDETVPDVDAEELAEHLEGAEPHLAEPDETDAASYNVQVREAGTSRHKLLADGYLTTKRVHAIQFSDAEKAAEACQWLIANNPGAIDSARVIDADTRAVVEKVGLIRRVQS